MKLKLIALTLLIPTAVFAITPDQIASDVATSSQKITKAEQIKFTEATDMRFVAYVVYKTGQPTSQIKAKKDTEHVARSVLAKLVSTGRQPSMNDPIFVHVHAIQKVQGETREGFREIGKTRYNFNTDRLEYIPEKR